MMLFLLLVVPEVGLVVGIKCGIAATDDVHLLLAALLPQIACICCLLPDDFPFDE
jgi:hypothetical protein